MFIQWQHIFSHSLVNDIPANSDDSSFEHWFNNRAASNFINGNRDGICNHEKLLQENNNLINNLVEDSGISCRSFKGDILYKCQGCMRREWFMATRKTDRIIIFEPLERVLLQLFYNFCYPLRLVPRR